MYVNSIFNTWVMIKCSGFSFALALIRLMPPYFSHFSLLFFTLEPLRENATANSHLFILFYYLFYFKAELLNITIKTTENNMYPLKENEIGRFLNKYQFCCFFL